MADTRYLAVIADGPTDARIYEHLVKTLLHAEGPWECISVQGSLRDAVDAFWAAGGSDSEERSICSESARALRRDVLGVINAAYERFAANAQRAVSHRDLLLVTTDSERHLTESEAYLRGAWPGLLPRLIGLAVDDLYHSRHSRHHPPAALPLICHIVPFPSTDVLVAAADLDATEDLYRGRPARELKRALYGTDDLSSLGPERLEALALRPIDREACIRLCQRVPEVSRVLRQLAWNAHCSQNDTHAQHVAAQLLG